MPIFTILQHRTPLGVILEEICRRQTTKNLDALFAAAKTLSVASRQLSQRASLR